jgi:hypothetical protein
LTRDNQIDTWADYLAQSLDIPLINLAQRGAGYQFINHNMVAHDFLPGDLCVVMWPSADRFDLWVDSSTPHLQADLEHASWLDGRRPQFVDLDHSYNDDRGWYINGAVPRGIKHHYYKFFYSESSHTNQAWITIAQCQRWLDALAVDHVMTNSYPLARPAQYHQDPHSVFDPRLWSAIDHSRFVPGAHDTGFVALVRAQGFDFFNRHYPVSAAHQWFVDHHIMPCIQHLS